MSKKSELANDLERARRIIAELENALAFIKAIQPQKDYPGDGAYAHSLGAAQGRASVALCAIPKDWRCL